MRSVIASRILSEAIPGPVKEAFFYRDERDGKTRIPNLVLLP
jgi:hypothetical protein